MENPGRGYAAAARDEATMNAFFPRAVLATAITITFSVTATHAEYYGGDQEHPPLSQQDDPTGSSATGAIGIASNAPADLGFSAAKDSNAQDNAMTLPVDQAGLIFGMTDVAAFVDMRSQVPQATWVRVCRRTGSLQAINPALPALPPVR
jgi:hypothetical protein